MWSYESARSQETPPAGRRVVKFTRNPILLDTAVPLFRAGHHARPRDRARRRYQDYFLQQQRQQQRERKQEHQREMDDHHRRQEQALKPRRRSCSSTSSRSSSQERQRQDDIEGIARLIKIFNPTIVLDGSTSPPEYVSAEASAGSSSLLLSSVSSSSVADNSSATFDEGIDASKNCSRCRGERTVRRAAGEAPPIRRMLCKACAVKHGMRSRSRSQRTRPDCPDSSRRDDAT